MRVGGLVWLVIVLTVSAAMTLSGCLSGGEGGDESRVSSLVIDFKGSGGSVNPGNLTTWTKEGGAWSVETHSNDGHTMWIFNNVTSGLTVLDLLERCAEIGAFEVSTKHYVGMGTLVESIDGVQNEKPGRGWQYYVNDQYATQACDLFEMENGDIVTWVFADVSDMPR